MSKEVFKSVSEISSNVTYVKPAELADREVVGTYKGLITGQFGPNYKITTKDGEVVVNGCGALNSQMSKVNEGDYIRFVYKGKKKIKEGPMKGKDFHDIDVQKKEA